MSFDFRDWIHLRIERKEKYQVSANPTIGTITGEPLRNRLHGRDWEMKIFVYIFREVKFLNRKRLKLTNHAACKTCALRHTAGSNRDMVIHFLCQVNIFSATRNIVCSLFKLTWLVKLLAGTLLEIFISRLQSHNACPIAKIIHTSVLFLNLNIIDVTLVTVYWRRDFWDITDTKVSRKFTQSQSGTFKYNILKRRNRFGQNFN